MSSQRGTVVEREKSEVRFAYYCRAKSRKNCSVEHIFLTSITKISEGAELPVMGLSKALFPGPFQIACEGGGRGGGVVAGEYRIIRLFTLARRVA